MLYILYTLANTVVKGIKHSGGLKKAGVKCESEITGSTILNLIIKDDCYLILYKNNNNFKIYI